MKASDALKIKSAKLAVVGAVLAIVAAVGETIYGFVYAQYADFVVVLSYLLGAALLAAYACTNKNSPAGSTCWAWWQLGSAWACSSPTAITSGPILGAT